MIHPLPTLDDLASGRKRYLSAALAAAEARPRDPDVTALLDRAFAAPRGLVVGLTGTPGVGKSTLVSKLLQRWRGQGLTVGVLAVDPSSRLTGGALLGDRTRIATDPDDAGAFVRSVAARDRLGGLADVAVAAVVLMRAVFDRVIVESVGIGQSETEVATVSDVVVLCLQPGAGDSLQFMKAGVMEMPDVILVTKADMGALARRAKADVEGALSLGHRDGQEPPPVLLVSSQTGDGFEGLDRRLEGVPPSPARRLGQAAGWIRDAVATEYGRAGIARLPSPLPMDHASMPFSGMARALVEVRSRLMVNES